MAPKSTPTLATIAAAAGCSTATVSRALRSDRALPIATVQRIQRIAARLGYRTNPLVSEMMRQMRGVNRPAIHSTLAYLVFGSTAGEWRHHLTYVGFHEGAQSRARELGFGIEIFWADEPGLGAARLTQILRARGITGVIVGPSPGLPVAPALTWQHFAAVKIGVPYADLPLPCIMSNHYRSMQRVIEETRRLGHHRLGLVLQEHQVTKTSGMWLAPLALHQQHLPPADRVAPLILKQWREALFAKWLREHRPEVIIGLRSELMTWASRSGLRVPEDVGFVHLDRCTEEGNFTGMNQLPHEMGARAVDLLSQRLLANERDVPTLPLHLLVDSVWVPGATVTPRSR